MPEKDTILRHVQDLPTILSPLASGKDYEDHEIWEEDESGTHFKFSKEIVPPLPAFYYLSVSGREEGVKRVLLDFEAALGKPLHEDDGIMPGIKMRVWDAGRIDSGDN